MAYTPKLGHAVNLDFQSDGYNSYPYSAKTGHAINLDFVGSMVSISGWESSQVGEPRVANAISPAGWQGSAFGNHWVTPGAYVAQIEGFESSAVGAATITATATLALTGFESSGIGSAVVSGTAAIAPTGIASTLAFGTPTLSGATGSQTITGSGWASSAFGTLSVAGGPHSIYPTGINPLAFGTATVRNARREIRVTGINKTTIGNHAVIRNGNRLETFGWESSEFGQPELSNFEIHPPGIVPDPSRIPRPRIGHDLQVIDQVGRESSAVGTPKVDFDPHETITPRGWVSSAVGGDADVRSTLQVIAQKDGGGKYNFNVYTLKIPAFPSILYVRNAKFGVPSVWRTSEVGTPTVMNWNQDIKPPGFCRTIVHAEDSSSAPGIRRPGVSFVVDLIRPEGWESDGVGEPTLENGTRGIRGAGGIGPTLCHEQFGTARVRYGDLKVLPDGFASSEFGDAIVSAGAVALAPNGWQSSEIGGATLASGIRLDGWESSAIGTPALSARSTLALDGWESSAIGDTVLHGSAEISASGWGSSAFGTPVLTATATVAASGWGSSAVGEPTLSRTVPVQGWGSSAFGDPALSQRASPAGWASSAIGAPRIQSRITTTGWQSLDTSATYVSDFFGSDYVANDTGVGVRHA